MKAQIKEIKPEFTPVTLEITCESIEDLKELWHRFNLSYSSVEKETDTDDYNYPSASCHKIWCEINNKLGELS